MTRESLKFKLKGAKGSVDTWGFEYVKNLAGEIGKEWDHRTEAGQGTDDLKALVEEIVPFNIKHNSEPEACDLLMEVDLLPDILQHVNENNYNRVALYLLNCANYVPEPEDSVVFNTVYQIYLKVNRYPEALRIAIRLNSDKLAQVKNMISYFFKEILLILLFPGDFRHVLRRRSQTPALLHACSAWNSNY